MMTEHDMLIAALTADRTDVDGVYFPDDRYVDWSTSAGEDGVRLELGNHHEATVIEVSRADVARIQRGLTLWLLQHPAA